MKKDRKKSKNNQGINGIYLDIFFNNFSVKIKGGDTFSPLTPFCAPRRDLRFAFGKTLRYPRTPDYPIFCLPSAKRFANKSPTATAGVVGALRASLKSRRGALPPPPSKEGEIEPTPAPPVGREKAKAKDKERSQRKKDILK